jgi:hypothetical protein
MKIKDAVVDQFREKFGVRPDVDNVNPSLRLIVRGVRNQFNIALDTSGDSLFMRGYRKEVGEAPLKENLAGPSARAKGATAMARSGRRLWIFNNVHVFSKWFTIFIFQLLPTSKLTNLIAFIFSKIC